MRAFQLCFLVLAFVAVMVAAAVKKSTQEPTTAHHGEKTSECAMPDNTCE